MERVERRERVKREWREGGERIMGLNGKMKERGRERRGPSGRRVRQ